MALSFLLLLERESTAPASRSKVPMFTEDALAQFGKSCGTLTKDDAFFLLEEAKFLFHTYWTTGQSREGDGQSLEQPCSSTLSEVVLIIAKLLCEAGYWDLASGLVDDVQSKIRDCAASLSPALVLGRWAVNIHRSMSSGEENGQAFTECARTLRSLPGGFSDWDARAVLEGCGLVVWAVEAGQNKGLSGPVLLAWFSFLEEHQELLLKRLQKVSMIIVLCISL